MLPKFKYVGGKDTGINSEKQKIVYNIVFPIGKAVEVPEDVAQKLRTKAGRNGDEFVEVLEDARPARAETKASR